jgi:hypothetical protein
MRNEGGKEERRYMKRDKRNGERSKEWRYEIHFLNWCY